MRWRLWILGLALLCVQPAAAQPRAENPSVDILMRVAGIRAEPDATVRATRAHQMAGSVRDEGAPYTNQAIDAVAGLLTDPDAFVRVGALRTLGNIGPGAKRAAPAIVLALQDYHAGVGQPIGGLVTAPIYCNTLLSIEALELPADCEWWLDGKMPAESLPDAP